jgi:Fatty acid desaturase
VPTMTLAHATFAINTVNHLWGSRRFETVDESRNNVLTAFFAAGEGWHNNHHRYQRAARNGFYWWEFDLTWYVIRAMAALGLAWDLHEVPTRIYTEARTASARRSLLSEPDVRDERQVIRRDEREPRPRQRDAGDLELARVVDVIEVEDRKDAGVGAPAL